MSENYPQEVEKLVKDFEHWRKTRKFPKEAVPLSLIKEFIQTQHKFPSLPMKSILNITGATLKRYNEGEKRSVSRDLKPFDSAKELSSQLIKIPQKPHHSPSQKHVIEIETLAGIKIRIFQ